MQEASAHSTPDRFDIIAAICRRGLSFVDIGRALDPPCSGQAVRQVVFGDTRSKRIVEEISRVTDYSVEQVDSACYVDRKRRMEAAA